MANLPESSTFDAGVYQIETTDPVIGGPSGLTNTPLKNLANRTKYLKDQVDSLSTNKAPLASPALTGTPTAPTAANGTATTQIATTAFVSNEISNDRPFEATATNIKINGTQSAGTLNSVARGDHVHPTDTTRAPLASPALTGTPTAPTAAQFNNSTNIATTAFVQRAIGSLSGSTSFSVNTTLTAAQSGMRIEFADALLTLPAISSVVAGTAYWLSTSPAATNGRIGTSGSDVLAINNQAVTTPYKMGQGCDILVVSDGVSWRGHLGSEQLRSSSLFASNNSANGYLKLPNGMIIQWGTVSVTAAGATQRFNFPLAFPTGAMSMTTTFALNTGTSGYQPFATVYIVSTTQFDVRNYYQSSGAPIYWIAIGY